MKKFIAFTLAETLIVMGIIGVVAALTLPNLNSSTGDKETVARVQKVYSNLNDAFGRAEAIYGPIDEWFVTDGNNENAQKKRCFERITEFMKLSKSNVSNYSATLADGTALLSISPYNSNSGNITVFGLGIDINGPNKGKNKSGYDRFTYLISRSSGVSIDGVTSGKPCATNSSYIACGRWVLEIGNLDYLKCYDKLSWEGNHTCK